MSILVTVVGEITILFLVRRLKQICNEKKFFRIAISLLIAYLLGVFMITLGHRTTDYAGETNLVLFSTFQRMFAPTVHRLQEWGFPRGLRELRWIGYKSWESVILNLLMLLPLGYLLPLCYRGMKRWWSVILTGFVLSLLIETLQLLTHKGWFDVDDIFLNTLGALIGYGLYKAILRKSSND